MVKRGLILADLQYPLHNPNLLEVVEKYMKDEKWDYLVYLGDIMDMTAINHHAEEAKNFRDVEGRRLIADYQGTADILKRHRKIVGDKCEIYFVLGNHEEWAEKLVDARPALEGMIEIENNLPFEHLKIKTIPYRHHLKLGKLYFIHGDISPGRFGGGANHAKKIVETYNRNVVYGHHHTLQTFTKISPIGIDETHSAYCIPALADTQPAWNKDKPNAWLNGFGVFYISQNNFSVLPVVSVRDNFIAPNGKLYG